MRVAELRPLVDEHRRLDAALHALNDVGSSLVGSAPARSPAARTRPAKTSTAPRKRAPRGANREAVLRALQERPGATSGDLAAASGVDRNTLYALLARLVKSGVLQTRALPAGKTGYAIAQTIDDAGWVCADDTRAHQPSAPAAHDD